MYKMEILGYIVDKIHQHGGTVYLPPTDYMGFPNDLGISVIYDGTPVPYIPRKKKKFPWVLVIGKKRRLI